MSQRCEISDVEGSRLAAKDQTCEADAYHDNSGKESVM